MRTISKLKIMAAALVMGLFCSSCVIHRDHRADIGTEMRGGTFYAPCWYA